MKSVSDSRRLIDTVDKVYMKIKTKTISAELLSKLCPVGRRGTSYVISIVSQAFQGGMSTKAGECIRGHPPTSIGP